MSLDFLEDFFRHSMANYNTAFPEGFLDISDVLARSALDFKAEGLADGAVNDFIVSESSDKLTLFNTNFAVWLVPGLINGEAVTRGYIALNQDMKFSPELAFEASGKYNNSSLILEALRRYLYDIRDTEKELRSLFPSQ
ncbi:hypothetical protein C6H88_04330 [Chlamydia muridarum str. Nigg]|uniref:Uncharacterized protein n=1 Tax=Chlamydia muridarum TaxID=83560 RepID=A0A069ZQ57_CHLMR|nr:hypothetical protein [Chlamydia muridarum]AHH23225.1 hypothetical protein TAC_04440 [Chlamydia muridarum str. Nigg3 CMUT3-5]AHH24151.1 hypothetical protein Y015_04440 [Chlamydia muridarum str. Nigg CM972]AID38351.1 hypothetical protein BB17_04495 [Chlamydia muridarum str. Nigg 2 MCR]AIT91125.1 hypothetical protein NC80_04235 [Chlamydia muridarum]AIT92018.1 hypothetical protein NC81_04255 [Chlamydia muridarum]